MLSKKQINQTLRAHFRLAWRGYHGAPHWARVAGNGRVLCERLPVNRQVVYYFSLFHDISRADEGIDHGHGLRSARLLEKLGGAAWLGLEKNAFHQLFEAMAWHSESSPAGSLTQQVCWDADRLDLARVGIIPDPHRLFTDAARQLHFDRLHNGYY